MTRIVKQKFGGAPLYVYKMKVTRVHDGDTFFGQIDMNAHSRLSDRDLGFHQAIVKHRHVWNWWVRLSGMNAIELANPGGKEAQAHLSFLILNKTLSLHSHLTKVGELDLYERILGQCYFLDGNGVETGLSINQQMINAGYAAPWDGHGPRPTPLWPIPGKG